MVEQDYKGKHEDNNEEMEPRGKHFYNWQDIEKMCTSIVTQMYNDNLKDYIVGITRGGNITIISNMSIRCEALKVSLRDDNKDSESNCWMAEDAFGYLESKQKTF